MMELLLAAGIRERRNLSLADADRTRLSARARPTSAQPRSGSGRLPVRCRIGFSSSYSAIDATIGPRSKSARIRRWAVTR
jgi:hypothetical protein